jgi:DNA-binding CsgD family transcriptional regulator
MPDFVNFGTFSEKFLDIKFSYGIDDERYAVIDTRSVHSDILIPLSILKGKSCGRTIISYLKSKGLSFSDIARILNRDARTVWTAYKKASMESYFDDNDILIPVEIFSYRGFSILESVVFWLKSEKQFDYVQIARLLGKNYQTIRTVYKRALNKIEKNTNE